MFDWLNHLPDWLTETFRRFPAFVMAAIAIWWYVRRADSHYQREITRIASEFRDRIDDLKQVQQRELHRLDEERNRLEERIAKLEKERDKLLKQLGVR